MKKGILFISYDGVLEPLGQSQVLSYIERLAQFRPIHLMSFEKAVDRSEGPEHQLLARRMANAGIAWHQLRYHKRPSVIATTWDVIRGAIVGCTLIVRYRLGIVHARSYVPSVMALIIKRITGANYLFDMRGFWADERLDGGLWVRDGRMYILAKWFERRFLLSADHVVSLTIAAVQIMKEFEYLRERSPIFTVIPTCADLQRFQPNSALQRKAPFVLGYLGTVGSWYLFDEVAVTFSILLRMRPESRFLVVNRGEREDIRRRLLAAGVPESAVEITSAPHSEMPALIARMTAGIFFLKSSYSKQASAPTKLAELLGCGVPCLSNVGVGDFSEILAVERVGIVVKSFDEASLTQGLVELLRLCVDPEVSDRCIATAHRYFSLDEGVTRYESIYQSLDCLT